jgi:inner membrane protein
MPSPIAHSVSGYVISRLFLKDSIKGAQLAYGVAIANAADLDFIPQILTGIKYHHGFSHSIMFCLGVSAMAAVLGYGLTRRGSLRLFLITLLLYGSHLVLDFFTDGGAGIQLLWPFEARYFKSAVPLFPSTHWSEPLFQHPGHWLFVLYELAYAALLVGIEWGFSARKRRGKWRKTF